MLPTNQKPSFSLTGLKQLTQKQGLPHTLRICIDRNKELTIQKREYLLQIVQLKETIRSLKYYSKYTIT